MRPAPPRSPTRPRRGGSTGVPDVGPVRDSAVDMAYSTGSVACHEAYGPPIPKSVTDNATRWPNRSASAAHDVPNAAARIAAVHHDVGGRRPVRSAGHGRPELSGSSTALRLLALCSANGMLAPATVGSALARRATRRRFDLQHVGAEVGEQPAHGVGFGATQIETRKGASSAAPSAMATSPLHQPEKLSVVSTSRSTHSRWASVPVATYSMSTNASG